VSANGKETDGGEKTGRKKRQKATKRREIGHAGTAGKKKWGKRRGQKLPLIS